MSPLGKLQRQKLLAYLHTYMHTNIHTYVQIFCRYIRTTLHICSHLVIYRAWISRRWTVLLASSLASQCCGKRRFSIPPLPEHDKFMASRIRHVAHQMQFRLSNAEGAVVQHTSTVSCSWGSIMSHAQIHTIKPNPNSQIHYQIRWSSDPRLASPESRIRPFYPI